MAELVQLVLPSSRLTGGRSFGTVPSVALPAAKVLARYRWSAGVTDAGCALSSTVLATVIRFGGRVPLTFVVIGVLLPLAWPVLVAARGGYERRYLGQGPEEYRRILQAGVLLFAVLAVASFSTRAQIARGYVLPVVPLTVLTTLAARRMLRARLYRWRRAGRAMQRLVVIGRLEPARSLAHELMRHPEHGLHPVAVVHPSGATPDETTPLTGDIAHLVDAIRSAEADVVAVVSEPDLSGVGLRRLAWALEDLGIDLLVAPGIVEVAGPRLSVRAVAGLSLLHLERPSSEVREIGKVILDRALAVGLLVAVLPALLVVVAAIRAASRGPILLRELRIGAAGQPFTMLRLRVPGVDRPAAAGLTRVIRRYRLDELPQLLNVLSGSMSLVGPRPRLPEHAIGDSAVMRRLRVRPGMTGLRQLGGGRALSREESLRLDLRYVDNWSVTLDLVILARSLLAIAKGQVEGSVTSAGQEQEPEGG